VNKHLTTEVLGKCEVEIKIDVDKPAGGTSAGSGDAKLAKREVRREGAIEHRSVHPRVVRKHDHVRSSASGDKHGGKRHGVAGERLWAHHAPHTRTTSAKQLVKRGGRVEVVVIDDSGKLRHHAISADGRSHIDIPLGHPTHTDAIDAEQVERLNEGDQVRRER